MTTCEFLINDPDLKLYFGELTHQFSDLLPFLQETEKTYCIRHATGNLDLVRAHQRYKVKEILNDFDLEIKNSESGRPLTFNYDLGFSHKHNGYLVGITKLPHRIGVDLEDLDQAIDWRVFGCSFFSAEELHSIKEFCHHAGKSSEFAKTLFFSMKEAICKAKDVAFLPKHCQVDFRDSKLVTHEGDLQLKYFQKDQWIITLCLTQ